MDAAGDYTFGRGGLNYLVDSPAAVAQRAGTRLRLWEREWYLDLSAGTPYFQDILGNKNIGLAQEVIRNRILGTPYSISIDNFTVIWNNQTRKFEVLGTLNTAFGSIQFGYPTAPFNNGIFTVGSSSLNGSDGLG